MIAEHHRILVVDDNPAIHEDFRKILIGQHGVSPELDAAEAILFDDAAAIARKNRSQFEIDSAYQGQEALLKVQEALAAGRPYSMAFVDVRMPPGWDGIETIAKLWEVAPSLQVVICTAYSDYSWDKMTDVLGVSENLVLLKKPFDNIEVLQLSHALTKKWLVTGQAQLRMSELSAMVAKRTRELEIVCDDLRVSEERFSQAFQSSPMPQAIQTLSAQRFVDANPAFLEMTGFSRNEVVGRTPLELRLCLDYETRFFAEAKQGRPVYDAQATVSTRNGELRQVLMSLEPMKIGSEPHVLLMMQDISDRMMLEAQLRQSQKMEAIGQLAAGVAHDFNNLLTVIQGHASMHAKREGLTPDLTASLHQISGAAARAADLTRKLLSFSRRGMVRPKVLDLTETIRVLSRMLKRLLGERTTLKTELADGLPRILADSTSVEQVLMNLTLNARDAMPEGGEITIKTQHVKLGSGLRNPDARPGSFVCLSVKDTGTGMDEVTRSRIFEPFYTTKGVNKGTGMGLATVYGIVKQHDGWTEVETAPGKGSTFSVYLPSTDLPMDAPVSDAVSSVADEGNHTILVVEDDSAVRMLVTEVLQSCNYHVIEAESGDAAIALWPQIRDEVDLLLTDMMMPGKSNGLEVSRYCKKDKPALKVIFTSGYSSELFGSDVSLKEGVNYLPKPYLSGKLTDIIHRALSGNGQV